MKILFLVSSMGGGGAERVAALLCNAWASRGEDVVLMPTFSGRGEIHYGLDPRVKVAFLADHVQGRTGKLRRLLALRRMYQKMRPDIVVSFLTDVNLAALLAGLGMALPIIVAERTYPPLLSPPPTRLISFLRRRLYPRAATVIAQTTDTADWIRQECGDCHVSTIPNPVSPPAAETQPRGDSGRKLVLSVGRLIASKRFELLQNSFAALAADFPDWDLCILGEGPLRDTLERHGQSLRLGERMVLPGFTRSPGDWYAKADIFVLTSAYEGMPNTLIEAMTHGVAPIAFDIKTGPREVLKGGRLGILLPDDTHVERLTAALRHLMTDKSARDTLAKNATRVLDDYELSKVLTHWDQVIIDSIARVRAAQKERL